MTAPRVDSLTRSIGDLAAHIVLADGTQLVISWSNRVLGDVRELLMGGTTPERWYLGSHASQKPDGCSARTKAYSEDGAAVVAFEEWPGVTGLG